MSRVTALEGIIRLVDHEDVEDERQHLILFDTELGKVVEKPRRKLWRQLDVRRYVVNTESTIEFKGKPFNIQGQIGGEDRLEVEVIARLTCSDGKESRLVEALAIGTSPEAVLDKILDSAAKEFEQSLVEDGKDPISEFFDVQTDWQESISRRLKEDCGLRAVVKLEIGCELTTIKLKDDFPTYVKDCDDPLTVAYSANLEVRDKKAAILSFRRESKFQQEVSERVRLWIPEHTGIHDYCQKEELLADHVRDLINAEVAKYGRYVGYFKFERSIPFELPSFDKPFAHSQECIIKHCKEKVRVDHTVMLQLIDVAKFRKAKVNRVDVWVKRKLEDITQQILFDQEYVDVVTTFGAYTEMRIKELMIDEVKEIGCVIEQFSSVSNVEKWQADGIQIEIKDAEFSTRESRVSVKLSIVGTGTVEDIDKVKPFIGPGADLVEDEILPEVKRVSANVLHTMSPERFYTQFAGGEVGPEETDLRLMSVESTVELPVGGRDTVIVALVGDMFHVRVFDPDGVVVVDKGEDALIEGAALRALRDLGSLQFPDVRGLSQLQKDEVIALASSAAGHVRSQSAEMELTRTITKQLLEKYGVKARITVKQADTELTKRYHELRASRLNVSLTVAPKDGIPVTFRATFRIRGVYQDKWDTFQSASYERVDDEIADISTLIKDVASQFMNQTLSMTLLRYQDNSQRERLQKAIFEGPDGKSGILEAVRENHGLQLEVTSFQRESTFDEVKRREGTEKLIEESAEANPGKLRHLQEKLDLLRAEEKRIMIEVGADDEELNTLQEKISEIESKLESFDINRSLIEPYPLSLPNSGGGDSLSRALLGPPDSQSEDSGQANNSEEEADL